MEVITTDTCSLDPTTVGQSQNAVVEIRAGEHYLHAFTSIIQHALGIYFNSPTSLFWTFRLTLHAQP